MVNQYLYLRLYSAIYRDTPYLWWRGRKLSVLQFAKSGKCDIENLKQAQITKRDCCLSVHRQGATAGRNVQFINQLIEDLESNDAIIH